MAKLESSGFSLSSNPGILRLNTTPSCLHLSSGEKDGRARIRVERCLGKNQWGFKEGRRWNQWTREGKSLEL